MQLTNKATQHFIIEMDKRPFAKVLALAGMAVAGYHSNFPACESPPCLPNSTVNSSSLSAR